MTQPKAEPSRAAAETASGTRSEKDLEARSIREGMECVVLPARPGSTPSDRPPIEIYLGTEPAQYRANRAFAWSIEKVRDPGREVRIRLMSELPGFDRRGWTTGFTNFRFAIPALAGASGRAIYNDEDQIYLTDPGVLFDHDLGGAAHLSTSDTESSVMLIDCEAMAPVWTLEEAQHAWKRKLLRKATKATGLRGDLDPGWNARDEEFQPGESHLLHYTTLHTQPWRPFPERFVYQKGSYTDLWHALEREAITEGFELFRRDAPSRGFDALVDRLRSLPRGEMGSGIGVSGELAGTVEELVQRTKASSLVELTPDLRGDDEQRPGRFGLDAERRVGLLEWLGEEPAEAISESLSDTSAVASSAVEGESRVVSKGDAKGDGVICVEGLEDLPVWDIPWIIETLFERAGRFVLVAVRCAETPPRRRFLLPPQGTTHTPDWWRSHFEAASVRHPEVSWQLLTARGKVFAPDRIHYGRGGPRLDETSPRVWTLTDGAPGNDTQVEALVRALGWPADDLRPGLTGLSALPFSGQGVHLRTLESGGQELGPPWPELLIVAGRRVASVARWVREASRGRTLVVALGWKAATPPESVDLAVTRRGVMPFPHPNRLEVERPLVPLSRPRPARGGWHDRIEAIPGRRIVVLVGSGTERLGLDAAGAESLGRIVAESAAGLGASVLISASRHASRASFEGVVRGVGRAAFVHQETRDQKPGERAWPALIEAADLFVMAGIGETTLAEICATGRPVFLAPQLSTSKSLWMRVRDSVANRIVARANARPENDRGTTRPQQGLELLCAKLVARGWVRPRRDFEALRGRLVRSGEARLLRAPIRAGDLDGFTPPPEPEVQKVAARVRYLLGVRTDEEMENR